ncbi:hypothetical protein NIES4072_25640 [Nostoc commune NIES-4072]|uniref:Collagen-like protein n=1 Tax=Nostoc commune NIES-4072 TaxID=2005467 RepID=A0A2R5FLK8_NOSCO|nr:hypothetical protein [Nostoc commune]BBD63780.1 hypothetical protein NIES4070_01220 [Nostoc commune HK-02]GBG18899.1 hypothetical protein NIES4072_25640 [Nostoc commune NIES-4072]
MNINQPLQYILKLCLLATTVNALAVNVVAAEVQIFGQDGRHGVDGRSGRDGNSATERIIRASEQLQTIDIFGTDGEAGESATSGEQASGCQQPQDVTVNVCGAKGGNGGNGGNGGRGGYGGNATVYFESLSQLKNVVLHNRGGRAGVGGKGGQAGSGCNCTQPRWTVNYCTWALMAQQINVDNAQWREVNRELFRCSGDAFYDEQQDRPQPAILDPNYRYGWKYIGLSQQRDFTCENGLTGQPGRNGIDGEPGSYGQVLLVKGTEIPQEQISYSDRVSLLVDRSIRLIKKNLSKKMGLQSLLGIGSDVRDSYRLLETVQNSFKVSWQTIKRPEDLGDPPLKTEITESGKLQFYIPGTLDYILNNSPNQTEITITGGIHPKRLGRFKFKGFDRFPDPRNFTLLDEGKLLGELKTVKLTIILSQNNSKVSEMSYPLVPHQPYPHWADAYQINLGDRFDSWLKPEQPVEYEIRIEQTAHSGVTYTSGMKIGFVVDKVTHSPDIQYYSGTTLTNLLKLINK